MLGYLLFHNLFKYILLSVDGKKVFKISPYVDPLWSGEIEVWKRRLFVKAQWEAETEREKFGTGKREKAVGGVFLFHAPPDF